MSEPLLKLYAVRNSDGLYFRAKGFRGHGESWVRDLANAKIYGKTGQAQSRVTFFSRHYPQYPPPVIIELRITEAVVVDQTERLRKREEAHAKRAEKARVEDARLALQRAQEDLQRAEQRAAVAEQNARRYGVQL